MSYVVSVWEQEPDVPFATTWEEVEGDVDGQGKRGRNPKFLALTAKLLRHFPFDESRNDDKRYWLESIHGDTDDAVLRIAIDTNGPLDTVQALVAVEANRLGLNMFDEQAGEAHLANGTKLSLHDRGWCVQALVDLEVYQDPVAARYGFQRLAAGGNRYAQRSLGIILWQGMGIAPNRVLGSALVCLAGAEDADSLRRELGPEQDAAREALLARMRPPADLDAVIDAYLADADRRFEEGDAAARRGDLAAARECLMPLAEEGHPRAQMIVSLMHSEGRGVPKNPAEAAKWVRRAAASGSADAQYQLGAFLEQGFGVERDPARAAHWYRRAARQHHKDGATERSARALLAHEDASAFATGAGANEVTAALDALELRAVGGDINAAFELGEAHFHGRHDNRPLPRNPTEAVRWYRQAARHDHAMACFSLGNLLLQGDGVEKSASDAAAWIERAARAGLADAQYNLGVMHQRGDGVARDDMRAAHWLGQAAEQFHPAALRVLGALYGAGQGVTRDPVAALALTMAAAASSGTQDTTLQTTNLAHVDPAKALAEQMLATKKVLLPIAQWRRFGGALPAQRDDAIDGEAADAQPPAPARWQRWHVALVVGAAWSGVLLTVPGSVPPGFARYSLIMLGTLSALYGAWRASRELGWSGAKSLLWMLLAVIPGVGTLACALLLLWVRLPLRD